jgi:hypothetical protein
LAGLIFASTLSTGALWRDSLPLGGGQLSSGSLVLLTGDATTQVEAYAFTALAGRNLRPGSSAQAPLTMKNDGSTPLGYRLSETTTIGSATLPAGLTLRIDGVTGDAACSPGVDVPPASGSTTGVYAGPLAGATTPDLRPLAPAATETLCVRVAVAETAPASVSGDSAQVRFTFAAVQA